MTRGVRQEMRRGLFAAGFNGRYQPMISRLVGGKDDSRRWCMRGKPIMDTLFLEMCKVVFNRWVSRGKPPFTDNFTGERFLRECMRDCMRAVRGLRLKEEISLSSDPGSGMSSSPVKGKRPRRRRRDRPSQPQVKQEPSTDEPKSSHSSAATAARPEGDPVIIVLSSDESESQPI